MSKRKWHHPEVPAGERVTKVWRSAGELEDTPALRQWVDREFPRAAESMRDEDDRESTRRDFLKVMGHPPHWLVSAWLLAAVRLI